MAKAKIKTKAKLDPEIEQKLEIVIAGLEKQYGKGIVGTLSSNTTWERFSRQIPSGSRGLDIDIWNVVAIGGVELVLDQVKLISRLNPKKITTFLDSDAAGLSASKKVADCLAVRFSKVCRAFPQGGGDPDDLLDRESFLAGIRNTY